MKKTAFIFPGQGAQTPGMGKDFYEQSTVAREIFDRASELIGINMCSLCFEENEFLNRTDYTQAALVTACGAMVKEMENQGLHPDITAGLSLGEYTAIYVSGGMEFEDALDTVWYRGQLMHQASLDGSGSMAAILGLTGEQVAAVTDGIDGASVANYNCPGQVVITGRVDALEKASAELKKAGARRITPLKVSGPFHSVYMEEAGRKLGERLEKVNWKPLILPYVTNVNAEIITDIRRTPALLQKQVCGSVYWEQSIRRMIDWGTQVFVEIGPGRTLTKFLARIDSSAEVHTVNTMEDMYRVAKLLKA